MVNSVVLSGVVVKTEELTVFYQVSVPGGKTMVVRSVFNDQIVKELQKIFRDGSIPVISVSGFLIPEESGHFGFVPGTVSVSSLSAASKYIRS